MNTNEHTSYDVVLLPTYAEALSYRKRVAAEAGPRALFGVTVATFPAWIADLWELFGDGRVIASPLEVEALSASLCSKAPAAAGCARVVTACLQNAGIPAFDEACARAKRGEDCGVTFAQARCACAPTCAMRCATPVVCLRGKRSRYFQTPCRRGPCACSSSALRPCRRSSGHSSRRVRLSATRFVWHLAGEGFTVHPRAFS